MRSSSLCAVMVALAVLWAASSVARAADFPQKWVYASADMTSQRGLDTALKDLQEYKAVGITHVLLNEGKIGRIFQGNQEYIDNAKKYQDQAKQLGIAVVPAVYPLMGGSWLRLDGNVAAGIPAKQMPFIVKDGAALPDPASGLPVANSGFEQAEGDRFTDWGDQPLAGKNTFVDKTVKHSGNSSLKITASPNGRVDAFLSQNLSVKPFQYYRLSVWVKSQGLDADRESYVGAISREQKRRQIWTNLRVRPTQEWTLHQITFNTMEGGNMELSVGAGDLHSGTIWFDDLKIEPAGPLLILRRDLTPLTITSQDGSITYEEGKDFAPLHDPITTIRPNGLATLDQEIPKIVLADNSRIKNGQTLLVSFYHPIIIYDEKENLSIQEPKVLQMMDDQMKLVARIWPTGAYFMSGYDEIRVGGWELQSNGENLTCGQLLARHLQKGIETIHKYSPEAAIYTWSDMFTPYHNAYPLAKGHYYLVNGNWDGSWEGLPKDVTILNWHGPSNESMKFFSDRGNAQIMCGYYDARGQQALKRNIENWMKVSQGVPNVLGFMYTTWTHNFDDVPAFFQLINEYPKWATGSVDPGQEH